jgi:hypothetical protein
VAGWLVGWLLTGHATCDAYQHLLYGISLHAVMVRLLALCISTSILVTNPQPETPLTHLSVCRAVCWCSCDVPGNARLLHQLPDTVAFLQLLRRLAVPTCSSGGSDSRPLSSLQGSPAAAAAAAGEELPEVRAAHVLFRCVFGVIRTCEAPCACLPTISLRAQWAAAGVLIFNAPDLPRP